MLAEQLWLNEPFGLWVQRGFRVFHPLNVTHPVPVVFEKIFFSHT